MPASSGSAASGVAAGRIGDATIADKAASALDLAPLQSIRLAELQRTRRAPGTCSLWKVLKETGHNLLAGAQQVVGALTGSLAASVISERMAGLPHISGAQTHSGISLALATSMSTAATGFISSTVTTVKGARLSDIDALRETYNALVLHSQEAVKRHPLPIQTAIYGLDKMVREAFSLNSKTVTWHEQKLRHREAILMSVPYYAKDIAQWNQGNAKKTDIQEKVRELIRAYPAEMRPSLENLIQRMRANSVSENPVRVQAYLYGPPGTGKTRFVKEVAKALGLPVVEIRLPLKRLETLYGYPYSVDYASPNTSDLEIIGELPQKLIASGYTNPIVFFDELTISNEQVLNGLKLLLDKSKKTIRVEAFDIELDWRRATVFCASNVKLGHAALIKRMPQLDFLKVSAEAKQQILRTTCNATMLTYMDALTAESMADLQKACRDHYDFILGNDTSPGSRDLDIVAENMVHLIAGHLIDGEETTEAQIRQHIERDFDSMRLPDQARAAVPKAEDAGEGSDAEG
jgi:hypothetical protein